MKLLFTSDLHGDEAHYSRLVALAASQQPALLILGGNCLPDDSALNPTQLGKGQPQFVRHQLRKALLAIREGSRCADILWVFGNHDWGSSVRAMEELAADGLVTLLNHRMAVERGGLSFFGYPCVPPTPWFVKEFERLDQPGDKIPLLGGARWDHRFSRPSPNSALVVFKTSPTIEDELAALKPPATPWVFVTHAPPFETSLDRNFSGQPCGSKAIRAAIERLQPVLSLHGHVKESPRVSGSFKDMLGRTVAINPGQSPRATHYVTIEIDPATGSIRDLHYGQQT